MIFSLNNVELLSGGRHNKPLTLGLTIPLSPPRTPVAATREKSLVRPVAFKPGAITYESLDGAPMDLARKLASRLKDWTGRTWLIAANGQGGGETMIETDRRKRSEERAGVEADPFVMAVMGAFPGAKIGEIKTLAAPVELPVIPDEAGEED